MMWKITRRTLVPVLLAAGVGGMMGWMTGVSGPGAKWVREAFSAEVSVSSASGGAERAASAKAAPPEPVWKCSNLCIRGVYPHLAAMSTSYSEAGIGALVPWADRLWYVSYVAHIAGEGVGLYEIVRGCPPKEGSTLSTTPLPAQALSKGGLEPAGGLAGPGWLAIRRHPASMVGTHANRMIHPETQQLLIGPYVIDAKGQVRLIEPLARERLTGTMRHLTDPARKVYYLAMEGAFYEVDLATLQARKLFELTKELGIASRVHFKGAYTAQGRVVVANNSYFEEDQRDGEGRGRLAEWDGRHWTILRRTAFCDVTTSASIQPAAKDTSTLWANGWDRRSVLLCVLHEGRWHTYRLPKGSQSYDQAWCTEWPRIRPLGPDLMLLDMHGLYYKMSPQLAPGRMAGLEPYAAHLKMTPDFCLWDDRLVLAGDENSSMGHRHRTGGQPQSNLWFGRLEDLGRWGCPSGWGGPWLDDPVSPQAASEPFLVRGFDRRCLHLAAEPIPGSAPSAGPVQVDLEVDPDGSGQWKPYLRVPVPLGGYAWHVLPENLEAVWMRLKVDRPARMSAQFHFAPGEPRAVEPSLFAELPLADQAQSPQIRGILLPFADRLWFCAYQTAGPGQLPQPAGLYEITESMEFIRRPESVPGIFSNRLMVGGVPGWLSIGPHLISADGTVRTIPGLENERLVASVRLEEAQPPGPSRPASPKKARLGLLTENGRLLEVDLATAAVLASRDISAELGLQGRSVRFRAAHTTGSSLIVAALGQADHPGLLAEQSAGAWRIIDRADYAEVCNLGSMSEQVVAVGWDAASTILMVRAAGGWQKYRLPKASEPYPPPGADSTPRIREVVTERMLLDAGGLFYEVSGLPYAWSVRPVATHGRSVADFCSWRGLLVLAGCQASGTAPAKAASESASLSGTGAQTGPVPGASAGPVFRAADGVGLWFGTIDDLWLLGKLRGVGGPWLRTPVRPNSPSDPYLMCHFDRKRLELVHDAAEPVEFTIEVDFTVQRNRWHKFTTLRVEPGQKLLYQFPKGFSAHWVRFQTNRPCRATAWLVYD